MDAKNILGKARIKLSPGESAAHNLHKHTIRAAESDFCDTRPSLIHLVGFTEDESTDLQTDTSQPMTKVPSRGKRGLSQEYDDRQCRQYQSELYGIGGHGILIPPSAEILEVDGVRLPITGVTKLQKSPYPFLFLPKGIHYVRFRPDEFSVQVKVEQEPRNILPEYNDGFLRTDYDAMRQYFGLSKATDPIQLGQIITRAGDAFDGYTQPFLLNIHAAYHISKGENVAARRKYNRALYINPTFSPSHLNLAWIHFNQKQYESAKREVRLAAAFNVGNVFGLKKEIVDLEQEINQKLKDLSKDEEIAASMVAFSSSAYLPREFLSEQDKSMRALMEAVSKYAILEEERAKILANLAIHFSDEGKNGWALHSFRNAMRVLRMGGQEKYPLAKKIMIQMIKCCKGEYANERAEYVQMYKMAFE